MDHNRDGFVDMEELTTWTIVSLYNIAGADAKRIFSFVDENNDNEMSWGEVSQESYDIDPDDNDSFSKEIEDNSDSFREYNKMYNRDKARFDATDNDGKINLQEYLNDWHVPPNKNDEDFIELETDRFNDEYDRNKDGFLAGDELLFWLSPDNTEIAIDEAEHLIDMCDEDEDEKLTPEEIVENHDLWVDSDATEYGAQLRHYDEL